MKLPHFNSKLFLAPMEVVNDPAFRFMCHKYGSAMQFTEMIGINAVVRGNKAVINLARTLNEEKPVAVQLFGTKTELIKKSIQILEHDYPEMIKPDMFDFNFGCSSENIVNQGAGAALLKRPSKIGEIISTMRASTDLPISAKIRLGVNSKLPNYVKIAKIIEENGADMITVHGRYQKQGFGGKVDLNAIKEVKQAVNIPVVGNGDVIDEFSAKKMLNETGCDYIMIGRAALGNPFIFERINYYLKKGFLLKQKKKADLLNEYIYLAKKYEIKPQIIKQQERNFNKKK
ncbi:MAG: tRNA-dihydrouridine synthase family protein [Candidatus Nanoarchaeia archaeon]|nr:tRNA-dihydrouridine synthase family protein [Candidatus Nanoarchaeia archaeon]